MFLDSGRASIAGQLVQAGADINAITNEGCTPLHRAASRGYADIVKLFISAAGSTASQLVSYHRLHLQRISIPLSAWQEAQLPEICPWKARSDGKDLSACVQKPLF